MKHCLAIILISSLQISGYATGPTIPRVSPENIQKIRNSDLTVAGIIQDINLDERTGILDLMIKVSSRIKPFRTNPAPDEYYDISHGIIIVRTSTQEFPYQEPQYPIVQGKNYLWILTFKNSGIYAISYLEEMKFDKDGRIKFLTQLREDLRTAPLK
ncbi:hypothetical protein KW791_01420 [Candidatus Parcubacteria bacterium]|nr:hypothetical protein [Candidatus Parcubacteria bacterium]